MARKRRDAEQLWRSAEAFRSPLETLFADAYRRQMVALRSATESETTPFNLPLWSKRVADSMRPIYRRIMSASGRRWLRQVAPLIPQKVGYALESKAVRRRASEVLVALESLFGGRLAKTVETTWDQLSLIVAEAESSGLGNNAIDELLASQWDSIFAGRVETIATSEVTGAINSVSDYLARELVELNEWVTARDERVRPTHVIYGASAPRPAGFNFAELSGGPYTLRYPADPECTEAGEVVNCRCILVPSIVSEPEAGTFDDLSAQFLAGRPPVVKTPGPHRYATTQLELEGDVRAGVLELAGQIADDDLAEIGRETLPHVTVLYGLEDDTPEGITAARELVAGLGPVRARLVEVVCFEGVEDGTADAVIVAVDDAGGLRELRQRLQTLPHFQQARPFVPHATLAYVKPGRGADIAAGLELGPARSFEAAAVVFRSRSGVSHSLPL